MPRADKRGIKMQMIYGKDSKTLFKKNGNQREG